MEPILRHSNSVLEKSRLFLNRPASILPPQINSPNNQRLTQSKPLDQQAQQEGVKEATKETTKEEEKARQKLDTLTKKSSKPLFKLSSKFPYTLFPDEISIELNQIGILSRHFLYYERQSIPIKNVVDTIITTNLFFASLTILYKETVPNSLTTSENTLTISFLDKKIAKRARAIIDGLIIAQKEEVDFTKIPEEDLVTKLEIIGRVDTA